MQGLSCYEILNILTSLLAIGVSVWALKTSKKIGESQREHNINSVRPIAAIKVKDYQGPFKVAIQNVGTGPLTICKLCFSFEGQEYDNIEAIMGKLATVGDSFIRCSVDTWTIGVGNELTFLSMDPSDATRDKVKERLSKIDVILSYKNIYDNLFISQRKLDSFERYV